MGDTAAQELWRKVKPIFDDFILQRESDPEYAAKTLLRISNGTLEMLVSNKLPGWHYESSKLFRPSEEAFDRSGAIPFPCAIDHKATSAQKQLFAAFKDELTKMNRKFKDTSGKPTPMPLLRHGPRISLAQISGLMVDIITSLPEDKASTTEKDGESGNRVSGVWPVRARVLVETILALTTSVGVTNLLSHQPGKEWTTRASGMNGVEETILKPFEIDMQPRWVANPPPHECFLKYVKALSTWFNNCDSASDEPVEKRSTLYEPYVLLQIGRYHGELQDQVRSIPGKPIKAMREYLLQSFDISPNSRAGGITHESAFYALHARRAGQESSATRELLDHFKARVTRILPAAKVLADLMQGHEWLLPLLPSERALSKLSTLSASMATTMNRIISETIVQDDSACVNIKQTLGDLITSSLQTGRGQIRPDLEPGDDRIKQLNVESARSVEHALELIAGALIWQTSA